MDEVLPTRAVDESAHTTGSRSAHNRPIEIITRGERQRAWTLEQKREIVAESLGSELTPAEVARKQPICSGELYTWRQLLLAMPGTVIERTVPRFAAVDLAPSSPDASEPLPVGETAPPRPQRCGSGMIENMLPSGVSLRVDAEVDGGALRGVVLQRQNAASTIPAHATVTWISYAGDEGGIVCKVELGSGVENATFTSLTHCALTAGCRWRAKSPPTRSAANQRQNR
jgi:transposase